MSKWIKLTPKRLSKLKGLREESGISPNQLLSKFKDTTYAPCRTKVYHWLNGNIKSAQRKHYDFVIRQYEKVIAEGQIHIPFTTEMSERIIAERNRTNISPATFMIAAPSIPEGLSETFIYKCIWSDIKTISKERYDFLLAQYKSFPDYDPDNPYMVRKHVKRGPRRGAVLLTQEQKDHLRALRFKSGVSLEQALRGRKVKGLSNACINNWLQQNSKHTVTPELYDMAVAAFEDAIKRGGDYIKMTDEMCAELRDLRNRCSTSIEESLKGLKVKGLTSRSLNQWLSRPGSRVSEKLYTLAVQTLKDSIADTGRIPNTPELRAKLKKLRETSRTSPNDLIKFAKNPPEDFSAKTLTMWMNGLTETVRKDYIEFAIAEWERIIEEDKIILTEMSNIT